MLLTVLPAVGQDIEPWRLSLLPIGANFGGLGFAFSSGDIHFNPVLQIQDGRFDLHTAGLR